MPAAAAQGKKKPKRSGSCSTAAKHARAEANKRLRARERAAKLTTAGQALPPGFLACEVRKRGRKKLPWRKLKPNSRWYRTQRDYAGAEALRCLAEEAGHEQHAEPEAPLRQHAIATGGDENAQEDIVAARELSQMSRMAQHEQRLLAERNPEGCRGLLKQDATDLGGASGLCALCFEETRTFTPCCGTLASPTWLCAACVNSYRANCATVSVMRGPGEWHAASHMRAQCPVSRCPGAFTNGTRALKRAV